MLSALLWLTKKRVPSSDLMPTHSAISAGGNAYFLSIEETVNTPLTPFEQGLSMPSAWQWTGRNHLIFQMWKSGVWVTVTSCLMNMHLTGWQLLSPILLYLQHSSRIWLSCISCCKYCSTVRFSFGLHRRRLYILWPNFKTPSGRSSKSDRR